MDEDEVDVFMSGGQDHRLSYAYDSAKDLTTIRIERYAGTRCVETWKDNVKEKVIILLCAEFFDTGEDAIISAIWDDEGSLSYEVFQFFGGRLRLKGARRNIPDGDLQPGQRIIGEKKGMQGRGICWNREEKKLKIVPYPTEPFHQSNLGVIVKFRIDEKGKVTLLDPNVKKGVALEKNTQLLILIQDDESPVIGRISFLGNICVTGGSIPGYFRFPFPSDGEVCITPIGFGDKAEKFHLKVE